jgi:hypothetical protein
MIDKNIEKPDPSIGQSGKDAVKKIDINAPFSLKEAEAVVGAEEGQIEEAIDKSKTEKSEKETRIAPDLVKLKKEQTEKKEEVKQKEKEVKEAVKTEKEIVTPSKFEGKDEEQRLKIYKEMESSHTKKSQRIAELEAKNAELEIVTKRIDDYEKNVVTNQQKATQIKIPPYPNKELFYDDPEKYHQQVKEHYDAKLNAIVAPLYGQNWENQKQNIINKLVKSTEKDIVPYKDVETEVESRLKKNPALVNQYGQNVREYFYTQIRNEQLPQKIIEMKDEVKEEAKRELEEENKENNESQIMTSDITTQKRESAQVDFAKQLDDGGDPEKVINAIKKKHGITGDI